MARKTLRYQTNCDAWHDIAFHTCAHTTRRWQPVAQARERRTNKRCREGRNKRCRVRRGQAVRRTARKPPAGARKRYFSPEERKMSSSPENLRTIPVVCSCSSFAGLPLLCSRRPRSEALASAIATAQWLACPDTPP